MAETPQNPGFVEIAHPQPAEIIGKPVRAMDDSERHGSFDDALAAKPIFETPAQKQIRDLASKANNGQLTNPDIQTALKLLLNARSADTSRLHRPQP